MDRRERFINSNFLLNWFKATIFKNTIIVLLGGVLSQGFSFFTFTIIARYFGPKNIALYSTSLLLLTLLLSISDSGLSNSIVNLVNKGNYTRGKILNFFKTGLYIRLIIGLLISLFGLLKGSSIATLLYNDKSLQELFVFAFLAVTILGLHSYIATMLQAQNKFISRAIFQFFTGLVRFLCVILFLLLFPNIFSIKIAFLIYILSPLIIIVFYKNLLLELIRFKISKMVFKIHLKLIFNYSKWLFLSMLAVLLISRIDQFMLLKMSTPKEVGYYAIATQLVMVFPLITESLTAVLLPKISNLNTDLGEYRRNIIKRIGPLSILFLLVIVPSKFFILFIFGESYAPAIPIFQILIIGFCIEITINLLGLIFYSSSKLWYLTLLNYIQLILIIIINLILIPHYNAIGSAIGTVAVRFVALIYIYFFSKKVIS